MTSDVPTARTTPDTTRALRARVRHLCHGYGIPLEQRARLVLSATTVARAAGGATVTARLDQNALVIILGPATPPDPGTALDLPLPPEPSEPGTVAWRIPLPATTGKAEPVHTDDEAATEAELRAVLARADALERDHRELKHELAETNSGVLAMYVELAERDERLRRAHAAIFRELEDALRPPPPTVAGVELAVHYQPAGEDTPTGGDLYDWFVLPDGTLHITVVDAVGHGVTCTRTALDVTHTVRTLAIEGHPLDDLVRRAARINPDVMATVLLARFDPATGLLHLANGSHPPALLVRPEDTAYLPADGRGVGFPLPGSTEIRTTRLAPGDLLLLYTDGLIESRGDADTDEIRLASTAHRHAALPVDELAATVVHEMHDDVRYTDDTLLLALRYTDTDLPFIGCG
ncbi:serine phosphatase RsbU (regulator of sigma subunit) [Saccharothrix carnea]|uniref:Serine phosphatase RsbU (Regulator of sigma subunit) n=1 Tax=Saccharothrix carnea TaxID=1280637 RepID=A0A2P8I0Q9_SACCR|nr:PP2C family protein-serine/threonine phosphatase [Saccharothrix carnea]PSL52056.1 serine phosphatase RsbU (regulator of sigma subunit) [Saccharothrix carnea]